MKCFCDGGCNLKEGTGYGSFKIYNDLEEVIYFREREPYSGVTSSTDSEYRVFLSLINHLLETRETAVSIEIYSDSKTMVNQLNGLWKVNSENLKELNRVSLKTLTNFQSCFIIWVNREVIVKELGH